MSSTDKTKLDGLVSNKTEVLYSGSGLTGAHTDASLATSAISNYVFLWVTGYDQYAGLDKTVQFMLKVSALTGGTTQSFWSKLPGWQDDQTTYFFLEDGYLRANNGGSRTFTMIGVVGIKA